MSNQVFVRVAACLAAALATFGAAAFAQTANPYSAPDAGGGYGYQGQPASPYSAPPPPSGYGAQGFGSPAGGGGGYRAPMNDAYVPPRQSPAGYGSGSYSPPPGVTYSDPGTPVDGSGGYGSPYSAPPPDQGQAYQPQGGPNEQKTYNQDEIIKAGHSFFGAVSQNLASAVEYAFQSQGRPNGYILGEDAGGAFVVGLRYGEGRLFTKDAGDYKVFWQGPTLGYDAGAEGSKTMVLVYNLRDPGEIYNRFGGIQGAAYMIGGVSVQFQKYNDVTLAIIRSGVGLRLGANVGYLNYTRSPTWNPL